MVLVNAAILLEGLVLLVKGSDYFVKAASTIAKKLGVSEFVIGLTLVAVGTSIPELASSVAASLQQASGIVVGNVVGLNIANIFLIPGVSGLLFPISIGEISVLLTALFMIFISTTLLSSSPQAGK